MPQFNIKRIESDKEDFISKVRKQMELDLRDKLMSGSTFIISDIFQDVSDAMGTVVADKINKWLLNSIFLHATKTRISDEYVGVLNIGALVKSSDLVANISNSLGDLKSIDCTKGSKNSSIRIVLNFEKGKIYYQNGVSLEPNKFRVLTGGLDLELSESMENYLNSLDRNEAYHDLWRLHILYSALVDDACSEIKGFEFKKSSITLNGTLPEYIDFDLRYCGKDTHEYKLKYMVARVEEQ